MDDDMMFCELCGQNHPEGGICPGRVAWFLDDLGPTTVDVQKAYLQIWLGHAEGLERRLSVDRLIDMAQRIVNGEA